MEKKKEVNQTNEILMPEFFTPTSEEEQIPKRVHETAEEIAKVVLNTPPKVPSEWEYLRGEKELIGERKSE